MSMRSLRADLQDLAELDETLKDDDISARLKAIDITLQGLEITQQRQAQDPRLSLVATMQQQRLQQDLRRLAYDVLGYQAVITVNLGENEPLPTMLAGLPPQLIRLAQDYINQSSVGLLLALDAGEESTYTQLARLLLIDDSISKASSQDTP